MQTRFCGDMRRLLSLEGASARGLDNSQSCCRLPVALPRACSITEAHLRERVAIFHNAAMFRLYAVHHIACGIRVGGLALLRRQEECIALGVVTQLRFWIKGKKKIDTSAAVVQA